MDTETYKIAKTILEKYAPEQVKKSPPSFEITPYKQQGTPGNIRARMVTGKPGVAAPGPGILNNPPKTPGPVVGNIPPKTPINLQLTRSMYNIFFINIQLILIEYSARFVNTSSTNGAR